MQRLQVLLSLGLWLLLPSSASAQILEPGDLLDIVIECSDGLDNDGDGHVDFPDDAGCVDAEDEAERAPTPLRRTRGLLGVLRQPRVPEQVDVLGVHVYDLSHTGRIKVGALRAIDPASGVEIDVASLAWIGRRPVILDEFFAGLDSGDPGFGRRAGSQARAVSTDGSFIAGTRGDCCDAGRRAYLWHGGSLEALQILGPVDRPAYNHAYGVSDDGIVVGSGLGESSVQPGFPSLGAARWDDQGAVLLDTTEPFLAPQQGGFADHITPDGELTVGSALIPDPKGADSTHRLYDRRFQPHGFALRLPTVWAGSDTRPVPLWPLTDDTLWGHAWDASDDGRVILGSAGILIGAGPTWGTAAFRWTQAGITWLGASEESSSFFSLIPWSTSADGALSVGLLPQALGESPKAAILAGGRLRSLVDLLENDYGVDLAGWGLSGHGLGLQISGDGRTIVGNAVPPGGTHPTAFAIRLPPACSDGLDNDGDGRIDFTEDGGCRGPRDPSEERGSSGGRSSR